MLPKSSFNTITHTFENTGNNHKLERTVLLHPPYSPDLSLPDFHIFRALKDTTVGKGFGIMKRLLTKLISVCECRI
jgi:hypothetical protein